MATRLAISIFALDCKILAAAYSDFVGINIRAANFGRLYEAATRPFFWRFLYFFDTRLATAAASGATAAVRGNGSGSTSLCSGTALHAPRWSVCCVMLRYYSRSHRAAAVPARRAYWLVTRRARCALQPSWSVDEVRGVARLSTAHRLHK